MAAPDKPQRLLVAAPSAYVLGGLATWLDYLLPGLREAGWAVTLGLVEGPRHHGPQRYLEQHPDQNWLSIRCDTGTREGRIRAVRRALRHVQPTIVMSVNVPDALLGAIRERAERGMDVRAVMSCHGIQPDLFGDVQLLGERLDAVVCTNRLACRLASEYGRMDPNRVCYATYGTALPGPFDSEPPDEVFRIAYVGRLEESQKRVRDLPKIAQGLERAGINFQLVIAGDGPDRLSLEAAVRNANLSDRFDFLGRVSEADLPQRVYRTANALVVTSTWETGPIVIREAMAYGVPVVTSAYLGSKLEDALHHGENCLTFEVGDCAAAAGHLRRLSQSESLRQHLITNGRRTVEKKYSHETSIREWDDVLRQIAALPSLHGQPIFQEANPQGRLDHWIGAKFAERLRGWFRRTPMDSGPGGEWPHTLSGCDYSDPSFWKLAASLDRREDELPGTQIEVTTPCGRG